jgi:WD40 repeat protein
LPTIDGSEAKDLIKRATGCLAFDHPVAGINALGVRDLKEVVVRPPNSTRDALHFVAGPDADGWIVFVDFNMNNESDCLKRIRIDGSSEESIFCGNGDALWDNPMSDPVLAPRGGNVAFLKQPVKRFAPPIVSGPIDVWNIQTKTEHPTNVITMNRGLSWFPDGKRLVYVRPGEPETIYVLDVETGERKPLYKGRFALVSTDGESLLVNTADGNLVVDLKTGESRKVD